MFFRLIRDNMTSYNLPSVTLSLLRDHLSLLFVLYRGNSSPEIAVEIQVNMLFHQSLPSTGCLLDN